MVVDVRTVRERDVEELRLLAERLERGEVSISMYGDGVPYALWEENLRSLDVEEDGSVWACVEFAGEDAVVEAENYARWLDRTGYRYSLFCETRERVRVCFLLRGDELFWIEE